MEVIVSHGHTMRVAMGHGVRAAGPGAVGVSPWLAVGVAVAVGGRVGEVELWLFFFFQAEDGIRDLIVTGVQTCALPISAQAPLGQVVLEPGPAGFQDETVLGPDGGQLGQVTLDLAPDLAERDTEHALTALDRKSVV